MALVEAGRSSLPADLSYQGAWIGGINYDASIASDDFVFRTFDALLGRGGAGFRLAYTGTDSSAEYTLPQLIAPVTTENYHPYLLLVPGQISFGSYRGHDRIIYWREQ